MNMDEDEEDALVAALMAVAGVIKLILWPVLAVILLLIAWKLSD